MAETILFVHGTGVRAESFNMSLELISAKAKQFLPAYRIVGCNWGDPFGARLNDSGKSIPNYSDAGAAVSASHSAELSRWTLLAEDPLLELKITPVSDALGGPEGEKIWGLIQALDNNPEVLELMRLWALERLWPTFVDSLVFDAQWKQVVSGLKGCAVDHAGPMARAVSAALFARLREVGLPCLSGKQREQLEAALLKFLGGEGLGIGSWLLNKLTDYAVPRRGKLSDASGPAVGDILRYQARGELLRNFIGEQAAKSRATIILAHSLGGIASVDWLATGARDVRALVTVGSQAPYFYEIDALASRSFGSGLPDFFPKTWLNFYDPRDLLSYQARDIFTGRAMDVRVDNGQPFPESHSAYWQNDEEVWPEIRRVLG